MLRGLDSHGNRTPRCMRMKSQKISTHSLQKWREVLVKIVLERRVQKGKHTQPRVRNLISHLLFESISHEVTYMGDCMIAR